jgi:hypothetical protein
MYHTHSESSEEDRDDHQVVISFFVVIVHGPLHRRRFTSSREM